MLKGLARIAMIAALGTVLAGQACAERSGTAEEQARLAESGRAIATEKCARCHAIGMNDTSTHTKAPPFRDVVERYPSENLAEALAEGIVSGHPDMPVFTFEPDEIEGFIAYLDSLARPAPAKGR